MKISSILKTVGSFVEGLESTNEIKNNKSSDTSKIPQSICKSSDNSIISDEQIYNGELEETGAVPGSFEHSSLKLSSALGQLEFNGNPETVVNALSALTQAAFDTIKYCSEQTTKQEQIRAKRDVAITQINATSELIKQYLDKTFDERKEIFNQQFRVVDEALRTGNTQMLSIGLQSINSLAAQSPFKNLSDINQVKEALINDDTIWDI